MSSVTSPHTLQRWFLGLASDLHVHATPCKHDANTMQARYASPSTCTCKPDASPMQARASTCSHMQVRDCNTSSHATHMQLTYSTHATLTHATLTCNSHMQHHMHLTHMHSEIIYYRACIGLAYACKLMQLPCSELMQRLRRNASPHAAYLHRTCIVLAS